MRIIISPAKKMNVDTDTLSPTRLPGYLERTQRLLEALRKLSYEELKALWRCNDTIAVVNQQRLRNMKLEQNLTPAILSYEGIQYRYMAPSVFEHEHFSYIDRHLRILSGFYGLLRPLDGVVPYRLEMQAKLAADGYQNLYQFWGSDLALSLERESDVIVNLASKEYSRGVTAFLGGTTRYLTCTFGELAGGKVVEKGTLCKMARGEMVRWMAGNNVLTCEQLKDFDGLGYRYSPHHSTQTNYVFIKDEGKSSLPDLEF